MGVDIPLGSRVWLLCYSKFFHLFPCGCLLTTAYMYVCACVFALTCFEGRKFREITFHSQLKTRILASVVPWPSDKILARHLCLHISLFISEMWRQLPAVSQGMVIWYVEHTLSIYEERCFGHLGDLSFFCIISAHEEFLERGPFELITSFVISSPWGVQ